MKTLGIEKRFPLKVNPLKPSYTHCGINTVDVSYIIVSVCHLDQRPATLLKTIPQGFFSSFYNLVDQSLASLLSFKLKNQKLKMMRVCFSSGCSSAMGIEDWYWNKHIYTYRSMSWNFSFSKCHYGQKCSGPSKTSNVTQSMLGKLLNITYLLRLGSVWFI